jgi:hypothetical protein
VTVDEIFHLATIRGPHAGSGCACNQCRQAEALVVAVQEIERLREDTANAVESGEDKDRIDWLNDDTKRLEDVRGHCNNDGVTVREAIDWLKGLGGGEHP